MEHEIRIRRAAAALLATIALLGGSPAARAAEATDGKALYRRYCSACHGASGKGDGVVAAALRPKPTDLTLLAKSNNGTFPVADIAGRIDGRETARVHGDPDMPVWGQVLRSPEGGGESRIVLITQYLASIQAK